MKKIVLSVLLLLSSQSLMAFTCYVTFMKSDCWQKHDVTIDMLNSTDKKPILPSVELKQDTLWVRKKFDCSTKQGLLFSAAFTPYIWQSQAGRHYASNRIWYLPATIDPKVSTWHVPICFPTNYNGVPTLPTVSTVCDCETVKRTIPQILTQ